jgi:hypothetical protein
MDIELPYRWLPDSPQFIAEYSGGDTKDAQQISESNNRMHKDNADSSSHSRSGLPSGNHYPQYQTKEVYSPTRWIIRRPLSKECLTNRDN